MKDKKGLKKIQANNDKAVSVDASVAVKVLVKSKEASARSHRASAISSVDLPAAHKNSRTSGMLGLICLYHNYKCLFTKHLVGAHKMRCSLSSHPC